MWAALKNDLQEIVGTTTTLAQQDADPEDSYEDEDSPQPAEKDANLYDGGSGSFMGGYSEPVAGGQEEGEEELMHFREAGTEVLDKSRKLFTGLINTIAPIAPSDSSEEDEIEDKEASVSSIEEEEEELGWSSDEHDEDDDENDSSLNTNSRIASDSEVVDQSVNLSTIDTDTTEDVITFQNVSNVEDNEVDIDPASTQQKLIAALTADKQVLLEEIEKLKQLQDEIQQLQEDRDEVVKKYEAQIIKLNYNHKAEIEELSASHAAEILKLKHSYEEDIRRLKEEYETNSNQVQSTPVENQDTEGAVLDKEIPILQEVTDDGKKEEVNETEEQQNGADEDNEELSISDDDWGDDDGWGEE